ncbi:MAG: hypothetical protein V4747_11505 [Pseudomonadota bacterium]
MALAPVRLDPFQNIVAVSWGQGGPVIIRVRFRINKSFAGLNLQTELRSDVFYDLSPTNYINFPNGNVSFNAERGPWSWHVGGTTAGELIAQHSFRENQTESGTGWNTKRACIFNVGAIRPDLGPTPLSVDFAYYLSGSGMGTTAIPYQIEVDIWRGGGISWMPVTATETGVSGTYANAVVDYVLTGLPDSVETEVFNMVSNKFDYDGSDTNSFRTLFPRLFYSIDTPGLFVI